mgnify:FL=1
MASILTTLTALLAIFPVAAPWFFVILAPLALVVFVFLGLPLLPLLLIYHPEYLSVSDDVAAEDNVSDIRLGRHAEPDEEQSRAS